ncbi:MAG: ABC transporter permease, partial [Planctomycetes bacterium]|nr:ABC transporter permease [Planctomycetota bacterium]
MAPRKKQESSADPDSSKEDEVRRELQFHIDMQTEENIRQGMDPDQARREAMRTFGGGEQIREEARNVSRVAWLADLLRDASLAARMLGRSPGFAVTVVLILGMAIGLSTTIFSFVQAILVKPLPYPNAGRLVVLQTVNPDREMQMFGVSMPDLLSWREQATSFEGIAAFRPIEIDLTDGQSTQRVQGLSATRNFFDVVGIPIGLGRTFTENEESVISGTLVVGHGLWKRRFRSDPEIVGKTQDVYSWTKFPN